MSSEVDICKLALSRNGDAAVITSIDPPDGSTQADHCATFYPMARDTLQEMHDWGFITMRADGSPVTAPATGWMYAYAMPNEAIKIIAVLPPNATNDYSAALPPPDSIQGQSGYSYMPTENYMPQQFQVEQDGAGNKVILTNQPSAVIRYTVKVTDTSKFSPLFIEALAWLLASYLAGPLYKGEDGMKMSQSMMKVFLMYFAKAAASDAQNSFEQPRQTVGWIANR